MLRLTANAAFIFTRYQGFFRGPGTAVQFEQLARGVSRHRTSSDRSWQDRGDCGLWRVPLLLTFPARAATKDVDAVIEQDRN
jgi:hypothetical protein